MFSPIHPGIRLVCDMSEKGILRLLRHLPEQVRNLSAEVGALRDGRPRELSELRGMLRRRGLNPYRENPVQHLLFPPTFSQEEKEQFYELFKRYSFRLFLREILNRRKGFRISEVVRFSSLETGRKYLHSLIDLNLAEPLKGHRYRLRPLPTSSVGPTLEWFMAEVLWKEFSCPALYGLRCKGTRYGGDFDVIASMEGRLLYIEVKSSPPKNIEGDEVHEFLSRLQDVIPHLAFFFVDTELRLKDKIVPIFEAERFAEDSLKNEPPLPIQRIADEIFFAPPRIYIFSSKRSIPKNIATCFKHHFTFPLIYRPEGGLPGARTN
jgi:hypothetical protein